MLFDWHDYIALDPDFLARLSAVALRARIAYAAEIVRSESVCELGA